MPINPIKNYRSIEYIKGKIVQQSKKVTDTYLLSTDPNALWQIELKHSSKNETIPVIERVLKEAFGIIKADPTEDGIEEGISVVNQWIQSSDPVLDNLFRQGMNFIKRYALDDKGELVDEQKQIEVKSSKLLKYYDEKSWTMELKEVKRAIEDMSTLANMDKRKEEIEESFYASCNTPEENRSSEQKEMYDRFEKAYETIVKEKTEEFASQLRQDGAEEAIFQRRVKEFQELFDGDTVENTDASDNAFNKIVKQLVDERTPSAFRLDELTPHKIVISSTEYLEKLLGQNMGGFTRGGFAGTLGNNEKGGVELIQTEDHRFSNITFKGSEKGSEFTHNISCIKTGAEIYEVEQVLPDGTNDIFILRIEPKGGRILCSEGNEVFQPFGECSSTLNFSNIRKPVLSFRRFKPNTEISVEVIDFAGEYEVIYPQTPIIEANNSLIWTVKTLENNLIETNNKKYPYLFWDGKLQHKFDMAKAYYIRRDEVIDYLERECEKFGFDETLITDFVTFWAPYLMRSEYVLVRFLSAEECNKVAKVNINSAETIQLVRAYLVYKPLEEQINLSEPELEYPVFDNSQPTIFDWGGFEHY